MSILLMRIMAPGARVAEHHQEGLLGQIGSFLPVTEHPEEAVVEALLQAIEQRLERFLVTSRQPGHQVLIVQVAPLSALLRGDATPYYPHLLLGCTWIGKLRRAEGVQRFWTPPGRCTTFTISMD